MTRRDWLIVLAGSTLLLVVGAVTEHWPRAKQPIDLVVAMIAATALIVLVLQAARRPRSR